MPLPNIRLAKYDKEMAHSSPLPKASARATTRSAQSAALEDVFEERAEHLPQSKLLEWATEFPHDAVVLKQLCGTGAKLLIGPRGCGKSTLLKRAYYSMLDDSNALPAYINYSKSLALEPLFHRNPNALALFRQWVLLKIVLSILDAFKALKFRPPSNLIDHARSALTVVESMQRGTGAAMPDQALAPSELVDYLERWSHSAGRTRVVLLMDDAAHAFSGEQQRAFFEIFRELRSSHVAPKAAVYPGITEYSPYFNVGHEGKLVEAWANVDDPAYLEAMRSVIEKRLPAELVPTLRKHSDIIDALSYASFGLPRSLLNMVGELIVDGDSGSPASITWAQARELIRANADSTRSVFQALSQKLRRYHQFVELGLELEGTVCNQLREYNAERDLSSKAVAIGIKEPHSDELRRVASFLEYAGIVRKVPAPVSRGIKGRFQRYTLHYSVLISENVLALGKRASTQRTLECLSRRDAHAFPKVNTVTLLGTDFERRCVIDLPPCGRCGHERTVPEARFCYFCGSQLQEQSVYEEALNASVDTLPLTARKIAGLKAKGLLRVKNIILLSDPSTLRTIPGVGPIWAARIANAAEEHVSV